VVSVAVVVAVLPDNNRIIAISAVPIPNVITIAIAITMTFTHGHALRTYSYSDFFRCCRNCAANTDNGGYCYCVFDHCVLPINVKLWSQSLAATNVPRRRENS